MPAWFLRGDADRIGRRPPHCSNRRTALGSEFSFAARAGVPFWNTCGCAWPCFWAWDCPLAGGSLDFSLGMSFAAAELPDWNTGTPTGTSRQAYNLLIQCCSYDAVHDVVSHQPELVELLQTSSPRARVAVPSPNDSRPALCHELEFVQSLVTGARTKGVTT